MPATEPPTVTTETRDDKRCVDQGFGHQKGSWRTLVQEYDGSEWVTRNIYPGDRALQWEAVATEERLRVARMRAAQEKAIDAVKDLRNIY